jgi:hypothetical protein
MLSRLAYTYVQLLLVLELVLFLSSLLLHLSVMLGFKQLYAGYGMKLFIAAIVVGIPTVPFIKDSIRLVDQVKSCPEWMWTLALGVGCYAIGVFFFQLLFPQSFPNFSAIGSAAPLAFDGMYFCILYSVVVRAYLTKQEVTNRAAGSVALATLFVVVFVAQRTGYLPARLSP